MDYMKLKLSVYESYSNNELTYEATRHLIDKIDDMYADSIVDETVEAENSFINSSLSVVTESADIDVLTEAAKTFADKVKALWAKFKAWVKSIIDKITGRKKKSEGTKVVVDPKLKGAMKDMSNATSKLKSARTAAEIAAALAAVAAATVGVKKYNKLKVENDNLSASLGESNRKNDRLASEITDLKNELNSAKEKYGKLKAQKDDLEGQHKVLSDQLKGAKDDYAAICEQNKTLIQKLQEATDVAAKRLETIQGLETKVTTKDFSIRALEQQLEKKKKELEKEKKANDSLSTQLTKAKETNSTLSKSGAEKTAKISQLTSDLDKQKRLNSVTSARLAKSEANKNTAVQQNLEKNAKIRQLTSEITELQKKLDAAKADAKKREGDLSSERDAANAKIKQMTPSYLMGVATQAIRALEVTTAIPAKTTATIDAEAKAKAKAEAIADAKKREADAKYIKDTTSKMNDFNSHVKKKSNDAAASALKSYKARVDNEERKTNEDMDSLKKMLGMM